MTSALSAAVLIVMTGLIACSLPRKDSIDGHSVDPIAQGPADLRSLAADLEGAFTGREWDRLLSLFDQDNYRSQLEIGVTTEQYLIEGIGLTGGDLPASSDGPYPRLSTIVRVEIVGYDMDIDEYYARLHGYAVRRDGRRLRIILPVKKDGSDRLAVHPPVG